LASNTCASILTNRTAGLSIFRSGSVQPGKSPLGQRILVATGGVNLQRLHIFVGERGPDFPDVRAGGGEPAAQALAQPVQPAAVGQICLTAPAGE
jgi:hypothetical protein